MPRPRKRKTDPVEVQSPEEETEGKENEEAPAHQAEPETETYPDPREQEEELMTRVDTYLDQEKEKPTAPPIEEEEEEVKKQPAATLLAVKQSSPMVPARVVRTTPAQREALEAAARRDRWAMVIMGVLALSVLVAGMLLGWQGASESPQTAPAATSPDTTVAPSPDWAPPTQIVEDRLYDVALQLVQIDERVDGHYVTFRVTNDSEHTVYFMANTMKLVGENGAIVLPELGKGDIPMTFTGGGIGPQQSDEATLVFKVPNEVKPASFLLENVTNMKNGTWTFQVNVQ